MGHNYNYVIHLFNTTIIRYKYITHLYRMKLIINTYNKCNTYINILHGSYTLFLIYNYYSVNNNFF